jgi:catechol 2,3-dioxygenase-like lactoylglutathione lyase family enzyme
MRIDLTSVFVDDQDKALKFYTEILGFVKKADFPVGEYKWLTVVSPQKPDCVELVLEPDQNPATQAFKQAIYAQGIPIISFGVDDIQAEYTRLKQLGVAFKSEPTDIGPAIIAVFDDTCGNLIQLHQPVMQG